MCSSPRLHRRRNLLQPLNAQKAIKDAAGWSHLRVSSAVRRTDELVPTKNVVQPDLTNERLFDGGANRKRTCNFLLVVKYVSK